MTATPPDRLLNNRYRLDEQYGSGGMAVVYRATDLELSRTVAIKILRPSLTGDEAFLTRFRQEARNVANLAHPNIVTVHDFQRDGNTYYIVMEFIHGRDLKKIIRAEGPLSIERTLDLGIQICAGIGYAHRAGLVHADVKPQNILVTNEEKVKITDFGIAQALAMTRPAEKQKVVWGSPHYFAPEQAQGDYPEPPADVYAIGVVLFEMLTGRLPFNNSDQQELALAHIRDKPPRISEVNPQVPSQLDNIIQRSLSKDPVSRHRTADQLGRILIAYKEQGQAQTSNFASPRKSSSYTASPTPSYPQEALVSQASPSPSVTPTPSVANQPPSSMDYAAIVSGNAAQTMKGKTADADYIVPTTPSPVRGYEPSVYEAAYQQPAPSVAPMMNHYAPAPSSEEYGYPPMPEAIRSRGYRREEPQGLDMVTLILAFVALIAVIGVVVLWIFVFNAWLG